MTDDSKTLEQMAEEFSNSSKTGTSVAEFSYRLGLKEGFFAGYQTAKREQFPGCKPDKVIFDEPELVANASMKNSEWISVKERLPDRDQEVLVYEKPFISTCLFWRSRSFLMEHQWELSNGLNCNPTHWMPLPEGPKEGK